MFRLETLGSLALTDGPAAAVTTQRRRLALLALLAVAGERGLTRDKLVAYLWPDSPSENARHALEQLLYELRRQLGDSVVLGPDPLRLNPEIITSDVTQFGQAIARGAPAEAVGLYRGPFLDGFYLSDAAEFERWAEEERSHLAGKYAWALEGLADAARDRRDHAAEAAWRRALAATDPLNGGSALRLVRALTSAGDGAGALQYARVYETLMREELDSVPDPPFMAFVQELRAAQAAAAAAVEPASPMAPLTARPLREHPTTEQLDRAVKAREGVPRRPAFGRPSRRIVAALAAIVTVITGAVVAFVWQPHRSLDEATDPQLVAVFPFRVAGAAPALSYLREGMVDLLAIKLTGAGGPRAVDPRAVLSAWRRAGGSPEGDPGPHDALSIARELRAGRLIDGGVVGTEQHVTLTASVLQVPSGRAGARASVEGPSDSLPALVDRLTAQLLAGEAGRTELASLASLPVLRAYFDGQRSYRLGRWADAMQSYERALQADSTFPLAAMGIYSTSQWLVDALWPAGTDPKRAVEIAWANRARLSARDRTLLLSQIGPRYPSPSSEADLLSAREQAAAAAPDRPEVWYELGDEYFHFGAMMGVDSPMARARDAFRRSLALDSASAVFPTYAEPLLHLIQIAYLHGDTSNLRRLVTTALAADSTADNAGFHHWIRAVASGDTAAIAAVRNRFTRMSPYSLIVIANYSQELGIGWEDAQRAVATLQAGPPLRGRDEEPWTLAHILALNRGRPRDALAGTKTTAEHESRERLHGRVLEALYWDGDTAAGGAAAGELERYAGAASTRSTVGRDAQSIDLCVVQQWRLAHGDSAATRAVIDRLRGVSLPRGSRTDSVSPTGPHALCAMVLEAWLATIGKRSDAPLLRNRLDSLMLTGPEPFFEQGDSRTLLPNLVLARLRESVGDSRGALSAVRRRVFALGPWFLSTYLHEEGRLAALAGDTTEAIRAYRQYLSLRSDPEPPLRPERDSVRAEVARLIGAQ